MNAQFFHPFIDIGVTQSVLISRSQSTVAVQDGVVVETGTHPELVEHNGQYAEMLNRQKESGAKPKSMSTASMSSATTSRAAEEGSMTGDQPRRVSRGVIGSLFGGAQAMLGYGSGQGASDTQVPSPHDGHA